MTTNEANSQTELLGASGKRAATWLHTYLLGLAPTEAQRDRFSA